MGWEIYLKKKCFKENNTCYCIAPQVLVFENKTEKHVLLLFAVCDANMSQEYHIP